MKTRYLSKRGRVYQFGRRVPDDVRPVIGKDHWRWSLQTDSLQEAEKAARKATVETDEIIEAVRSGAYRSFSDDDLDLIACNWSHDFQTANARFIPQDMFPHLFEQEPRIGYEAPNAILGTRAEMEAELRSWLEQPGTEEDIKYVLGHGDDPNFKVLFSPKDFDALIKVCTDTYHVSNPEISNEWKQVLADEGGDGAERLPDYIEVVPRHRHTPERRKLSKMFEKYAEGQKIGDSARNDFGLGVRRFIELHGDMDIEEVDRRHIEDFRDLLRKIPSRPPNAIRELPIENQALWAEDRETKLLSQTTINKNIGGVKVTLQYAFEQTSEIKNRDWRNPCDGFAKKPKRESNSKRIRAFTPKEIFTVFSAEVHKTKDAENFWIPLVLFYTGARLDEISQTHIEDVATTPIPFILCENLDDEDPARAKRPDVRHQELAAHSRSLISKNST